MVRIITSVIKMMTPGRTPNLETGQRPNHVGCMGLFSRRLRIIAIVSRPLLVALRPSRRSVVGGRAGSASRMLFFWTIVAPARRFTKYIPSLCNYRITSHGRRYFAPHGRGHCLRLSNISCLSFWSPPSTTRRSLRESQFASPVFIPWSIQDWRKRRVQRSNREGPR